MNAGRTKIKLVCLLCAAAFALPGCGKSSPKEDVETAVMEIAPAEVVNEPREGKYKDGVYTAGRKGYGGDIVVTATIANDIIVELKIEGVSETKGVGSVAIERMRERILEAQFGPVDGVSGATISSDAIKLALSDILNKAKY